MNNLGGLDPVFPRHYLTLAHLASVLSVWMLAGLFAYLRRYAKGNYFKIWTGAWVLYAGWLTLSTVLPASGPDTVGFAVKHWCLATSAVLLLWGSLEALGFYVRRGLLVLFIGFLLVWTYVGGTMHHDSMLVQLPVFVMFSAASLFIASSFYWMRQRRPLVGTALLAMGVLVCGMHLASYPFSQAYRGLYTASFLASTVLQLYLAVSMIVLLLEDVTQAHQILQQSHQDLCQSHDQLQRSHTQALKEIGNVRSEKGALEEQVAAAEQQRPDPPVERPKEQDWKKACEDLRREQAGLLQQERLQAMSRMASVIAHDLSNLLSPVVAFSELLLREEGTSRESVRQYLGQILTAGEDISTMVERMREFYRRRPRGPLAPVDLNKLVEKVVEVTQPQWHLGPLARGVRVEVRTELEEALPVLHGCEGELQEALTSLLSNAVEALPRGGQIVVSTRGVGNQPGNHQGKPTHLVLEVRDDGTGMEEYTRQHCVEPFFTTKGHQGGKGLGLAMVHGMMERHKGRLEVESELGKGTTVRLTFPRRSLPVTAVAPSAPTDATTRPLRILCVDDEPVLGQLLKQLLELKGHMVTNAYGGMTALDAFREALRDGNPFDVVITDLAMPGVDGREVTRCIKAESHDTPVVLLTGYGTLDGEGEEEAPTPVDGILGKPPRIEELNRMLAHVTRQSASARPPLEKAAHESRN